MAVDNKMFTDIVGNEVEEKDTRNKKSVGFTSKPDLPSGADTVVDTDTEDGDSTVFDFEDAVRSPYGMSELNNYLYDSKIQNVFKDYQENIASLNKSERQSLEDAYYVRELSKKYLGEYASNTGIGDVSGNLLDIYGNYQNNRADIKSNYDALEMNLTQEYRREKMGAFEEKMKAQYNMAVADFEEGSQEIMFNAVTGGYGDDYADGFEYLDAMKESGDLSNTDYQKAYISLSDTTYDAIETNITNGNYEGFETAQEYIDSNSFLNAQQKSVLGGYASDVEEQNQITDVLLKLDNKDFEEGVNPLDYIEENRELMGETEYAKYYNQYQGETYNEAINNFDPEIDTVEEYVEQYRQLGLGEGYLEQLQEGATEFKAGYDASKIDTTVLNEDSESYLGDDFDFNVNFDGENVDGTSYIYKDADGNLVATVKDSAYNEEDGWTPEVDDISQYYEDTKGEKPDNFDEITVRASQTVGEGEDASNDAKDWSYVYEGGRWYRQVTNTGFEDGEPISEVEMKKWAFGDDVASGALGNTNKGAETVSGENWELNDQYKDVNFGFGIFDKDRADTFTYENETYVQDEEIGATDVYDENHAPNENYGVVGKFKSVHGDKNNAVIFHNNNFYIKDSEGKIYKMKKE
ncbi:MAG: hypothetical protein PF513_04865 [Tenericutes bacterium]|jgi:ASC-1-like (ASCH) protein|nr:hypothetical protein [Mycoplasmatota bacterium]